MLSRRGPSWLGVLAQWALLGSLAVPANALRNHFNTPPERLYTLLGPTLGLAVFGAVGMLLLGGAIRWRAKAVGVVKAALAIMFPLVLITFGQAGWAIAQAGGRMQCGGATGRAEALAGAAARRVLWVVYDEMDQRTTFDQRPTDLQLPAFDRLRAESFSTSSALPPADHTHQSMPSFLTGLRVEDARLVGRNQLRLQVQGRPDPFEWRGADTIFASARALGVNTGLAGFFLPYCAMLGDSVTTCEWQPCVTCGRLTGVFGNSLGESMWHQASELLPKYSRRRHRAAYMALQDASLALAADPSIGFALLHLPVPHEPGIDERTRGAFGLQPASGDGYLHNLALADRSLGELRSSIESAGLWDKTTVMVFGDHGRRAHDLTIADKRVPFVVKMAGLSQRVWSTAPVDLLRVHDLTLEILAGRVVTTSDLVAWLGR